MLDNVKMWPFGVTVRVRDTHGFIVRRRIARADLPVLDDGLNVAQPPAALSAEDELKEQVQSLRAQLGAARAEVARYRLHLHPADEIDPELGS